MRFMRLAGLLLPALAGLLGPATGHAQTCPTPELLTSNVPRVVPTAAGQTYSLLQGTQYFLAVGARAANASENYDLQIYRDQVGSFPDCASVLLGSSTLGPGRADVVVGDFNAGANQFGTFYANPRPIGSPSAGGRIEWDNGPDLITIGASPLMRNVAADDVVNIWDVFLNAGHLYIVHFVPSAGSNLKALVFHNPAGAYWAGRSAAAIEAGASFEYTAPRSDWYGLAVVHDDGVPASYELGVIATPVAVIEPPPGAGGPVNRSRITGVTPNPTREKIRIEFDLVERGAASLELFDVRGRSVARLPVPSAEAGAGSVVWDGRSGSGERVPAGVYFVRMESANRNIDLKKVVVLD